MGVQAIKQALIQRAAASAAAVANVAAVSSQVSVQTALAAQAAYASTAAIPITGPAMAPAAAAAAATAAAGFGAPAVAAAAGVAGGRLYGGDTAAGSMYKINEDGRPEVFNAANGDQYMMSSQRGEVVSNKDAGGGGIINNISIVINSDGSSQTSGNGSGTTESLAENIKALVVSQIIIETQQGGALWEQQNGR